MQLQAIIILVLIASAACQDPQTVTSVCTTSRTKSVFCNDSNNCIATGVLIVCYGIGIGTTITCPTGQDNCEVSARGDSCSTGIPSNCITDTATFVCTGPGYYPDVKDCSSYFFCALADDRSKYDATRQSCTSGNIFDPNSPTRCSRESIFNKCNKFACNQTLVDFTNVQITYGYNRQYYAFCNPAELNNPTIFACPANSLPNLSSFPATCDYRCSRVGLFENVLDSSRYFECYLNNQLRLESIERFCAVRSVFVPSQSNCVGTVRSLRESIEGGI